MPAISSWTGREIKALRQAKRMSVTVFAEQLGVSDRMVAKWEAGGERIRPRLNNQKILDACLVGADPAARARFEELVGQRALAVPAPTLPAGVQMLVRHPVDGKPMTLIDDGPFDTPAGERVWLSGFFIDLLPTSADEYHQYATAYATTGPARTRPEGGVLMRVPWLDAQAYSHWAGKHLPTPAQLQRAATGAEGATVIDLGAEWCAGNRRAIRLGTTLRGPAHFRTVAPAAELLTLLAI